ncbi:glycerophosphodiester phosphodiesterase [Pseudoteredinibacter isoporae]|uniref:Glycerophosphoryl diester phosphodiesterase n=1 Tax=Pseudoteredinibacter isoporae TaxID=570281 RepID=A0A7X0JVB7_9GAMM|nr:glycerophosphodiester phosphodiesterase [Pseudoteredinibacter isoporae]MBB6522942.1 glycerophosphoryl diester phosphodiesterase [Pseudoteredinibacter isoporae]
MGIYRQQRQALMELDKPLFCIAHRGGSQRYENTLRAIERALKLGVDAIEIDVWNVRGELLVFHDRRLSHAPFQDALLVQQDPKLLRQTALPCGEHIPTLLEVMELIGDRALLNIELKGPGCVKAVSHQIEEYVQYGQGSYESYLISSFDHVQLHKLSQRLPEVKRGALFAGVPLDYAACCEQLNAYSLHACIGFLRQGLIDDASARGFKTWVYTVNHEEDMGHLAAMGVDGVFTDFPEKVLALNEEFRQRHPKVEGGHF